MGNDTHSKEKYRKNQNKCDQVHGHQSRSFGTLIDYAPKILLFLDCCRIHVNFSFAVLFHVFWTWLRLCYCWHSLWQHRIKYKLFLMGNSHAVHIFIFGLQRNEWERIIQMIRSFMESRRIIFSWYLRPKSRLSQWISMMMNKSCALRSFLTRN